MKSISKRPLLLILFILTTAYPALSDVELPSIFGEDRVFHDAVASIEGDRIIVSNSNVPAPVSVRYGWDDNPICNLYNKAGLPASPFRTDKWPCITEDKTMP